MKIFASNNSRGLSSNKLIKFLLIGFLVIVPMIILWVMFGQFNISGDNWIVPIDGKYYMTATLANNINTTCITEGYPLAQEFKAGYYIYHPLKNILTNDGNLTQHQEEIILRYIPNFGQKYIFNPIILAPIFGILIFNIILDIILSLTTKQIFLDIFPAMLSSWLGMFAWILLSLLPGSHQAGKNYPAHENYWTIAVAIIVILFVWIGSLILFNLLFNKIIIESPIANIYYEKLLRENKETETLKKAFDKEQKKYKTEGDNYVEI